MKIKLLSCVAVIAALNLIFLTKHAEAAPKKPNIIVIVADDLGYADLGCQVSIDIKTPNIDSMAINGVRCTSGYVSCPVCSPTRAGLLTGKYQQRFGHEFNPGTSNAAPDTFGLSLKEKTIADYLKAAGYKTGMVGKWHLGYTADFNPIRRGFDEFFGFPGGSHSYVGSPDPKNPIERGLEPVDEKEYLTEAFTREAVAFIDRQKKDSFFLYLSYNAVHAPLQVPEKYKERFSNVTDDKRRTYLGMLAALDDGVGKVLEKLRAEKLDQNTLIFFVSDNGGPTLQTTSRNDPLRGLKAEVLEGGIRVPFIVQWKGHLPAGQIYTRPVIALDILPTALSAANAPLPAGAQLDGVDLLPFLSGQNENAPHESLFWRYGEESAVRSEGWKLVKIGDKAPELYNLNEDIGEANNLASKNPDQLKRLQLAYANWNGQLMPPAWPAGHREKKTAAAVNDSSVAPVKKTPKKNPTTSATNSPAKKKAAAAAAEAAKKKKGKKKQ